MSFLFYFTFIFLNSLEAQQTIKLESLSALTSADQILKTNDIIWSFQFLKENQILFTEKSGRLKIYDMKTKNTSEVSGVPKVKVVGQGGLLDVQLDPDFKNNSLIYLSLAEDVSGKHTTAVYSAVLSSNSLKNLKKIFEAKPAHKDSIHFGSRIQFDNKNHIFITVGDRGNRELAQDLNTHMGKVIRINKDGSVPSDNPFVKQKALPEIWSYGHRNAQGLFFDKETSELWVQEHGPRGGDEINLIQPSKNYGWPLATFGREYYGPKIGPTHKEGTVQPVYHYTPSIAPSGLIKYKGAVYKGWKGSFISGALAKMHLNRLYMQNGKWVEQIIPVQKRVRDVRESTDGFIYFSTDTGEIYKLNPS